MPSDPIFAAEPDAVGQGAGSTNQVGQYAEDIVQTYDDGTRFDENDPPWGTGDETAKEIHEKYVLPHAQLLEALYLLVKGIDAAGQMTGDSAKSFAKSQDDAITLIQDQGRRRAALTHGR